MFSFTFFVNTLHYTLLHLIRPEGRVFHVTIPPKYSQRAAACPPPNTHHHTHTLNFSLATDLSWPSGLDDSQSSAARQARHCTLSCGHLIADWNIFCKCLFWKALTVCLFFKPIYSWCFCAVVFAFTRVDCEHYCDLPAACTETSARNRVLICFCSQCLRKNRLPTSNSFWQAHWHGGASGLQKSAKSQWRCLSSDNKLWEGDQILTEKKLWKTMSKGALTKEL